MLSHSTSMGLQAKGQYRARSFQAWKSYENSTVSEFEQVSRSNPGPPYRTGGPWLMTRSTVHGTVGSAGTPELQGTFYLGEPTNAEQVVSPYLDRTESQLNANGGKWVIQNAPTHPSVDLATSIGELRSEGLPGLPGVTTFSNGYRALVESEAARWKSTTLAAKQQVGGEYLNIQFGWAPFVGDIKSFARSVKDHSKIIRAYKKEASVTVKRRASLSPVSSTQIIAPSRMPVVPTGAAYFATGTTSVHRYQKDWYEATYRFRMPLGDDLLSRMSRYEMYANKLFGARIDPSTLWNLSPWSWAVDWFVDVGSILDAVDTTSQDGLVLGSAYAMSHNLRTVSSAGSVTIAGMSPVTLTRIDTYETKRRVSANPFGFGVSWDGLSAKQLAIAAALGMSR